MSQRPRDFSTSLSLIERVRQLDSSAWSVLSRLYGPIVYYWARRMGLQSDDAADVTQTVFISVWRARSTLAPDRPGASFRGWLWTTTRNAVRNHHRRRKLQLAHTDRLDELAAEDGSISDDDGHDGAMNDISDELTFRALEIVRESVDASTWDAFWATAVENRPVHDVAADLDISPAAVRQGKYRVLCRLRQLLADR
jgi:RNA polymerase sigma-70 factor (ECF subfamily)